MIFNLDFPSGFQNHQSRFVTALGSLAQSYVDLVHFLMAHFPIPNGA
jgi:hypothetical protein